MENQVTVSQVQDATQEEMQDVSLKMKEYIQTQNENHLQEIASKLNSRPGLLGALFPNALQREHNKLTVQRMKEIFKSQSELLKVYTNAQVELAKKQADYVIQREVAKYGEELTAEKLEIQKRLTARANAGIDVMTTEFEKSRDSYDDKRARQMQKTLQFKDIDPEYYEMKMDSLRNEAKVFFKSIDTLLEGFTEALQQKISNISNEIK